MGDPSPDTKKENNTPRPQNSLESLNSILAFQVQDLIDRRIDKAEGQLHEYNQNDLKRLSDKWKTWAIIATIFAAVLEPLAGYFIAPLKIKEWIKEYMVAPKLKEVVDGAIDPLVTKADALSKRIESLNSDISTKQSDIEKIQTLLREQLNIQQCVVAAKAGKRDKYEELKSIAEKKLEYKEFVDAALKDIEFYYEAIKYQLAVPTLMDHISQKDPGFSIEEVIYEYRESDPNRDSRESAIDTLIDYYKEGKIKENVVQELCESVDSEQNLRVTARTTRLLNGLTGKLFRSLEIDAVRVWWEQNKNEKKYQSPYKEYLKAREDMTHEINTSIILLLDKTIKAEADAFHARCLRGFILIVLKEYDKAENEFKIVEERNKDFRWLLLYKSLLLACQDKQDKIDEAVDLLNQALAKSPALEFEAKNLAKYFTQYKKVVEKENVKWPGDK